MSLGLNKRMTPNTQRRELQSTFVRGEVLFGTMQKPFDLFVRQNKRILEDISKSITPDTEIEIRFGSFDRNKGRFGEFNSKLQAEMVYHILHNNRDAITVVAESVTSKSSGRDEGTVRKIERNGTVTYEYKKRDRNFDIHDIGARIAFSMERVISQEEYDNYIASSVIDRSRNRYSFEQAPFRFDISEYIDVLGEKTYELEVEIVSDRQKLMDHLTKMDEIVETITHYVCQDNKRLVESTIRNVDVSPAQPIPLLDNIFFTNKYFTTDYAVTSKVDGMRKLLVFLNGDIFMVVGRMKNPSVERMTESLHIGSYTNKDLTGTILEAEYYVARSPSNPREYYTNIYVFDIVTSSTVMGVRSMSLNKRLLLCQDIVASISGSLFTPFKDSITVKDFFFTGDGYDIYTASAKALEWLEHTEIVTDGLIYQHVGEYTTDNTQTPPYKWKPVERITNDFIYLKDSTWTDSGSVRYILKCDASTQFEYEGNPVYAIIDDPSSERGKYDFSGKIVESEYDVKRGYFYPVKIRYDKPVPNSCYVCTSNLKSILQPLTEQTIIGRACDLMRKYHNIVKSDIIKELRGNVLDIGSGQGGDLMKWAGNRNITSVTAVEPSEAQLEVFRNRLDKLQKTKTSDIANRISIFNEGAQDFPITNNSFDCITAFFSLTFFYESREMFDKLVSLICRSIKPGGTFSMIVLDKANIKGDMGDLDKYGWEIKVVSQGDSDGFGASIKTTVKNSFVNGVEEYMFDFENFDKALTHYFSRDKKMNLKNTNVLSNYANMYSSLMVYASYTRNNIPFSSEEILIPDIDDEEIVNVQDIDSDGEKDIEDVTDSEEGDPDSPLSIVEGGGEGDKIDDGEGRDIEEVGEDERYTKTYANDNVSYNDPLPQLGAIVELEFPLNVDAKHIKVSAIGVESDRLNILRCMCAVENLTTLSPLSLLEQIIEKAHRSFLSLDGGMLAGGYQSRILEKRFGGYDLLPGEDYEKVMNALTQNQQPGMPSGIAVKVKHPELTIQELNNLAQDEFIRYLVDGYLGERSAAELLTQVLSVNIFIVDVYSPVFDWKKSNYLTSFKVRNVYSPYLGRIKYAKQFDLPGFANTPSVVLLSFNHGTYIPVRKVADQSLVKLLTEDRFRQYDNTRQEDALSRYLATRPENNRDPNNINVNIVRIKKPSVHGRKADLYIGRLGDLYQTDGRFIVRMHKDRRELIVGVDLDMKDLQFEHTKDGRMPSLNLIPRAGGRLENPARDFNTNLIDALRMGDVEEGDRVLRGLLPGGTKIEDYRIKEPVKHLTKKFDGLKIQPEIRHEDGRIMKQGDTLRDIVLNNPALFAARANFYGKAFRSPRYKTLDEEEGEERNSYRPPKSPSPNKYGVNKILDMKRNMLRGLAKFISESTTIAYGDKLGWIVPEGKRITEGKWDMISSYIKNKPEYTGKPWDRLPQELETVTSTTGERYTHYLQYDLGSKEEVLKFSEDAAEYIKQHRV